jgi:hypothetical protein
MFQRVGRGYIGESVDLKVDLLDFKLLQTQKRSHVTSDVLNVIGDVE